MRPRCARAFKITAHQPSPVCASTNTPLAPCMCDRTCQYRPAVHARVHQMHPAHGPREFDFQSMLCLGMRRWPGLPVPLTTRALVACGRAGRGGSCGKIALKPVAPPKLISSLFFCPLRLLWKKCRGRPIFHRLRVSKLSKLHILHMSYPCMVISSIIGSRHYWREHQR